MKSIIAAFIAIGFVGVALFGFTAMGGVDGVRHQCMVSALSGADCAPQSVSYGMFSLHLNAFRSFSSATLGAFSALFALLFAARVALAAARGAHNHPYAVSPLAERFLSRAQLYSDIALKRKRTQSFWQALHEHSPSLF